MFVVAASRTLLAQGAARVRLAPLAHVPLLRRGFRAKALYTAFPATLHYFSRYSVSNLVDYNKEKKSDPDDLPLETVHVAPDGLVYPGIKAGPDVC